MSRIHDSMNDAGKGAYFIWNRLVNKKHRHKCYCIAPKGIEELRRAAFAPRVRVSAGYWYLTDFGTASLRLICESLIRQPRIAGSISWKTVWTTALKALESELEMLECGSKVAIDSVNSLALLEDSLHGMIDTFEVFVLLSGLKLNGLDEVSKGMNRIGMLSAEEQERIIAEDVTLRAHPGTEEQRADFSRRIQEQFGGRLFLATVVNGDSESAKLKGQKQARKLINYFRFVICVLFHARVSENLMKIGIASQMYSNMDEGLCVGKYKYGLSTFYGRGRRSMEDFVLTVERLRDLEENAYIDEFVSILDKEKPSELEGSILTAIYWIGEAQDEYDLDVAFLKYFLSMEALFTGVDKPTHSLASRVASVNAFGGYGTVDQGCIDDEYRSIKRLYRKRSKIIHRGMSVASDGIVSAHDVACICRLAAFSILEIFAMNSAGYDDMTEVRRRIDSLYSGPKPG